MLSKFEELKLIAQCIATDNRDAFGQLVVAYQGALRRFLLNLTLNDASLTDDLAQETFLKAYLSIRSFKGISQFKTWLYKIAYNEFLTYRRKYGLECVCEDFLLEHSGYEPTGGVDAKHDLNVMLAGLNDSERTAVLLFYLEDIPIKKISEITGIPTGTIKSSLSRARDKMKTLIES